MFPQFSLGKLLNQKPSAVGFLLSTYGFATTATSSVFSPSSIVSISRWSRTASRLFTVRSERTFSLPYCQYVTHQIPLDFRCPKLAISYPLCLVLLWTKTPRLAVMCPKLPGIVIPNAIPGRFGHKTGQQPTFVSCWPDRPYMVGDTRFELVTPCMSSKYSNHLS